METLARKPKVGPRLLVTQRMQKAYQQRSKAWNGKSRGWQLDLRNREHILKDLRDEVIYTFRAYIRHHRSEWHHNIIPISRLEAVGPFAILSSPLGERPLSGFGHRTKEDEPDLLPQVQAEADVALPAYQLSQLLEPEEMERLRLDKETKTDGTIIIQHKPPLLQLHLALLKLADYLGSGRLSWVVLKRENWGKVVETLAKERADEDKASSDAGRPSRSYTAMVE